MLRLHCRLKILPDLQRNYHYLPARVPSANLPLSAWFHKESPATALLRLRLLRKSDTVWSPHFLYALLFVLSWSADDTNPLFVHSLHQRHNYTRSSLSAYKPLSRQYTSKNTDGPHNKSPAHPTRQSVKFRCCPSTDTHNERPSSPSWSSFHNNSHTSPDSQMNFAFPQYIVLPP